MAAAGKQCTPCKLRKDFVNLNFFTISVSDLLVSNNANKLGLYAFSTQVYQDL